MALDQLLKRNFWAVILVLVAVVAFLHARAIGNIVGAKLAPDESLLAAAPPARTAAPSASIGSHSTSADAILDRNPFDSVTGPLSKPPGELEDGGTPATSDAGPAAVLVDNTDPQNAPACDGVKVLIIAASPDPDWSFAAFAGADGKSMLRRKGGDAGNGKTVEFVGWDRVWLNGTGGRCQARMFAPPEPVVAKDKPAASAAAPPPAAGGSGVDPSIAKGIQKISATEFKIDRAVVDKILENQAELMRQARIVPEQENGKMVGIRLFGVRPETLLGVLGMENGDRLQTINGFDMTSPEKALEAYARLRTADHLTVQVNRKGQNTNLDYDIQ
jgi:general secretion pathway protein C